LVRFNDPEELRFRLFMGKLNKILRDLPSRSRRTPPGPDHSPTPNNSDTSSFRIEVLPTIKKAFIGRKDILDDVYDKLKTWKKDYPAIVVLIGSGGWGKSQIALEYARRRYEDRTYEAVFWVDACSEQAAKLGFANICERVHPSTASLTGEEKFA
jgi:hypothetical protein